MKTDIRRFLDFVSATDRYFIQYIGDFRNFAHKEDITPVITKGDIPHHVVGASPAIRSNWADTKVVGDALKHWCFESDSIAPEMMKDIYNRAGLPVSLMVFTGGKSLHFHIVSKLSVDLITWLKIAHGIFKILSEATKEYGALDEVSLRPAQAWRIPGYAHQKTGIESYILPESTWEAYPVEHLLKFADDSVVEHEINARHKKNYSLNTATNESQLTDQVNTFVADFGKRSESTVKALKKGLQARIKTIIRGRNAETKVFALADYFSPALTLIGVPETLSYFMSLLEAQLTPQDDDRGYAWNRDSYRLQIIRGLSAGLDNQREVLEVERVLAGKEVNVKYVSELELSKSNKLVFIKSAVGTGKTTALVHSCQDKTNKRILIVAPRIALVDQWLSSDLKYQLGFAVYNDSVFSKHAYNLTNVDRFITTVDSLHQLARTGKMNGRYDLVILDEADQLLSHLLIGTTEVNNNRLKCLQVLRAVLHNAGQVYAFSAHLSNLEVDIISKLANSEDKISYVNQHLPFQKTFISLDTKDEALIQAQKMLAEGDKVFVTCDSKEQAELIHDHFKLVCPDKKGFVITSNNSKQCSDQLRNLNTWISHLDYLVVSPSLSTGFDISCQHFDSVVGVFTNAFSLGFYDLEQALGRVRYPNKPCYFYVDAGMHWQEFDTKAVGKLFNVREAALIEDFTPEIDPVTCEISQYPAIVNQMMDWQELYLSRQIQERIGRRARLTNQLKRVGHHVAEGTVVHEDKVKLPVEARKQAKVEAIFNAPLIDKETYTKLLKQKRAGEVPLTSEQEASLTKFHITDKLQVEDITKEEAQWYTERGRKVIRLHSYLNCTEEKAYQEDLIRSALTNTNGGYDGEFHLKSKQALDAIMSVAKEYISKGKWLDSEVKQDKQLAKVTAKHKDWLKRLGIVVQANNPGKAITSLLDLLEYTVERKQVRVGNGRVYEFTISRTEEQLARVKALGGYDELNEALEMEEIY